MNIFTLIGRLGIFHLARRCVGAKVCPSLRYFIYIDGTCLCLSEGPARSCARARARLPSHAVFIGISRMSDESDPTLMILSSLPGNPPLGGRAREDWRNARATRNPSLHFGWTRAARFE
jgi:hypothetical protein